MTRYKVITRHLFRRTANREKRHLEQVQSRAILGSSAAIELRELGIPADVALRVSPRRWKGYWRVEMIL